MSDGPGQPAATRASKAFLQKRVPPLEAAHRIGEVSGRTPTNAFDYSVNISLQHKYFYCEVAKAGCSSVKRFLINAELSRRINFKHFEHLHYRHLSPLLKASQVGPLKAFLKRKDIVKFCFVRHPYDRLLSAYLDKVVHRSAVTHALRMQVGLSALSDDPIDFATFVEAACATPPTYQDNHWRLQAAHTAQEHITYDVIGKLETFDEDLRRIADMIGLDMRFYQAERPHARGASDRLAQYYTPALKRRVAQAYAEDFERFGYDA